MIDKIIYIGREQGCYGCRVLKPRFIELVEKHQMSNILYPPVDAESEEGEQLCEQYNVKSFPTVLFFDQNGLKSRFTGVLPDNEIEEYLKG